MTPTEFGYMIRGLCADPNIDAAMLGVRVKEAADTMAGKLKAPAQPAFKPLPVPRFCIHNVSIWEPCVACPVPQERVFGFSIHPATRNVYLAPNEDRDHGRLADGHPTARHGDRSSDHADPDHAASAEGGYGLPQSAFAGGGAPVERAGPRDEPRIRLVTDERTAANPIADDVHMSDLDY